jgi:hypothetical protein
MHAKRWLTVAFATLGSMLLAQAASAQNHYQPGYIVSAQGDTLRGLIDYRNWEHNPNKLFFKAQANAAKECYTPLAIKEFAVANEIYEGAIVETEVSRDDLYNMDTTKTLKIKVDTSFLQAIVRGPKSLYYYKNDYGKEFFYIKENSKFTLLAYKKFLTYYDLNQKIEEVNTYIGQLAVYLNDCPVLYQYLGNINYTSRSLEKLFRQYYSSQPQSMTFSRKTEGIRLEFGVLAGVSHSSVKFNSDINPTPYAYLIHANNKQSTNLSVGVFMDAIFPRKLEKYSFYNELLFTSLKVNNTYADNSDNNQPKVISTTLGCSYVKLNSMIRYKYPIKGITLYVNAGISNGIMAAKTNDKTTTSKFFNSESVTKGKVIEKLSTHEFGLLAGFGARYKCYSFETRYESGNGMSGIRTLGSDTQRIYFLLGYRF